MMKETKRLYNIAESICEMFNLTCERIDIQRHETKHIEPWYTAVLYTKEKGNILIRDDGTFEPWKYD